MRPAVRLTLAVAFCLLLLPPASSADDGRNGAHRRATRLPATGQWYEGKVFHREETPLERVSPFGETDSIIYLAVLEPGLDYSLGLRYPADSGSTPVVRLFDRWPFDPTARQYKLPEGPVVRTNPDWIEYRWRLGVSRRSPGNLAFITVGIDPRGAALPHRFRHFMYLVTPAVKPMNRFGTGITYLRGPSDLLLRESTGAVEYALEDPYQTTGAPLDDPNQWRPASGLIFNGDFTQGLEGWEMFSDDGDSPASDHLATGRDGLRLWSGRQAAPSGVRQAVQRDVQGARSLALVMTLRIDRESKQVAGTGAAAMDLAICYVDDEGADHCGPGAYRVRFSTLSASIDPERSVHAEAGLWFTFEDELMDLDPRPRVVKTVSITGGLGPEQDAWVRRIQMIEQGGAQ